MTFSEAVTGVDDSSFTLALTADLLPIDASVSLAANGLSATLTPTTIIDYAAEYTVTVTTDVADLAGNPLAVNFTSVFTTDSEPECENVGGSALQDKFDRADVDPIDNDWDSSNQFGSAVWEVENCHARLETADTDETGDVRLNSGTSMGSDNQYVSCTVTNYPAALASGDDVKFGFILRSQSASNYSNCYLLWWERDYDDVRSLHIGKRVDDLFTELDSATTTQLPGEMAVSVDGATLTIEVNDGADSLVATDDTPFIGAVYVGFFGSLLSAAEEYWEIDEFCAYDSPQHCGNMTTCSECADQYTFSGDTCLSTAGTAHVLSRGAVDLCSWVDALFRRTITCGTIVSGLWNLEITDGDDRCVYTKALTWCPAGVYTRYDAESECNGTGDCPETITVIGV